ncbi:hypothetical protein ACP4OV_023252 [Aristida adscensionis]
MIKKHVNTSTLSQKQPFQSFPDMAIVSRAIDAAAALFSLIMAVSEPLFDAQVVLPSGLFPAPLVRIHRRFAAESGHYLVTDPPPFFRGLVWLALAFLWPVSVANLYGILARRRWAAATSLMAGVYMLTYLACAVFGEMIGSGRATPKLLLLYTVFLMFTVALLVRGLRPSLELAAPVSSPVASSSDHKKRL